MACSLIRRSCREYKKEHIFQDHHGMVDKITFVPGLIMCCVLNIYLGTRASAFSSHPSTWNLAYSLPAILFQERLSSYQRRGGRSSRDKVVGLSRLKSDQPGDVAVLQVSYETRHLQQKPLEDAPQ